MNFNIELICYQLLKNIDVNTYMCNGIIHYMYKYNVNYLLLVTLLRFD